MTISQIPTTRASVTIESKGHARTTIPAMMLMTPKKMAQPRPGTPRSLTPIAVVDTPRKMNPTAIQMASKRIAYPSPKWRNANTARISDAAPLMRSKTLPPADTGRLNAKITCQTPETTR
jgi:hypothetical protein